MADVARTPRQRELVTELSSYLAFLRLQLAK
jgi:hypothetical protein